MAAVSAASGSPAQVGEWTAAPFQIPAYGIHSVVLPTGKVLIWSFPYYPNDRDAGRAFLWDPSKGTGPDSFTDVPPPLTDLYGDGNLVPTPIFCSGQSFLPNGDLLVAGGTLAFPGSSHNPSGNYLGLDKLFTFNPWTETWVEQPNLRQARWYPGQVELADGRTVILSGTTDDPAGVYNTDLEVFTPSPDPAGVGTVTHEPTG